MIHFDVHQEKGERFKLVKTTDRTQLAMMTLPPGGSSVNEDGNTSSDQVVYVVEGRIELAIGDDTRELRAGEGAVIPAASPYRMKVIGRRSASLFNIYGPPAFPAEEEARAEAYTGAGLGRHDYGSSG
ncbi:cupin domain-containing protein [Vulgatibacter incomptus]|uniref:Cupin type-2 domain-containing protein n=1 Tax=Vulgatibacter incomptus TaxID=1391653 RepID=A0A0K1P8Q2_9BACT|nr:cupin domain-containing protein [Vulgatibacter incomptus]AKU89900.1 hypothetical protein AKJ08_0287 [Vulgatibacter incomptus]